MHVQSVNSADTEGYGQEGLEGGSGGEGMTKDCEGGEGMTEDGEGGQGEEQLAGGDVPTEEATDDEVAEAHLDEELRKIEAQRVLKCFHDANKPDETAAAREKRWASQRIPILTALNIKIFQDGDIEVLLLMCFFHVLHLHM